ncbi:MAG: hypothetical protein H7Z13_12405 [Ferruginibacter sp.]|nr:hypothetical protein [Ferruginibacter sp.]
MKKLLRCLIRIGFLTLLFILYLFSPANAQHFILGNEKVKIEAGLNFGPTFFLGDLGGHRGKGTTFIKDVNIQLTKVMKGAFISFYPTDWFGFRIAAQYTYVEGRDELINTKGEDELYRKQRNLDFKSNMFEAYAAAEIFPLMLFNINKEDYDPRYRPYFFIGAGMFKYNPKGTITDQNGNVTWFDLKPLRTEGQGFAEYPKRKPYSLTQLNIPLGGGIKYLASERVNIAFELLYRKTFTDYIDDLSTDYVDPDLFDKYLDPADAIIARQINDKAFTSYIPGSPRFVPGYQRGNPKNMDAYFSFVLKFGVRLGDIYNSTKDRNVANQARCPARF